MVHSIYTHSHRVSLSQEEPCEFYWIAMEIPILRQSSQVVTQNDVYDSLSCQNPSRRRGFEYIEQENKQSDMETQNDKVHIY